MPVQNPNQEQEKPLAKKVLNTTFIKDGKTLVETIFSINRKASFWVWDGNKGTPALSYQKDGIKYKPPSDEDKVLQDDGIYFPTAQGETLSQKELIDEIRAFIRKWIDIDPQYEYILSFYALLTWCYDEFREIPYLHIIGHLGSGKSRAGTIMKLLCYKALSTLAVSSTSSLFRIIDMYRGTLILDESDLKKDTEKTAEITQILNGGYNRETSLIFRAAERKKEFKPESFNVFCPKIIISREMFGDEAFESRSLPIRMMATTSNRYFDRLQITDEAYEEATAIRNKLLDWRLRGYGTRFARRSNAFDPNLSARMNQLKQIVLCVIEDPEYQNQFTEYMTKIATDAQNTQGETIEAELLRTLMQSFESFVTLNAIAETVNMGRPEREKITPYKLSWYFRKRLNIIPERPNHDHSTGINMSKWKKEIEAACKAYGVEYVETNPATQQAITMLTTKEQVPF